MNKYLREQRVLEKGGEEEMKRRRVEEFAVERRQFQDKILGYRKAQELREKARKEKEIAAKETIPGNYPRLQSESKRKSKIIS